MLSEELLAADARARAHSIDPERSILLQAPAGSGKTAVLTQRFLRLLCTVEDPQEILAITFTLKAAAEMRGRIMRALAGMTPASDPCATELAGLAAAARQHAFARGWKLLDDPGALRIQTIDAFDYALASQLPLAARAGGTLTITETPGQIYRRAARHTLMAAERDEKLAEALGLLFERLDNRWETLERLLAQMLERRGHWLRYVIGHDPQELCARIDASLADIVARSLEQLVSALPGTLRLLVQALPGVGELGSAPKDLPAWQRLKFLTLTEKGWRRSLTARHLGEDFAPAGAREALRDRIAALQQVQGIEARLRSVARLPAGALSGANRQLMAALSRVLAHAAAQLQTQFAEERCVVDYTYVSGAARAALIEAGHPTELALRTGFRLRHILVDEFQDTSLAQFQLLEHLTAGWEEGDGRTLFVVGDPMQSIYRFRDAEVGLFITARERGIGGVRLSPLQLSRNFRATSALVEWTNTTFARVFPGADDLRNGAVAFSASVATLRAAPDAAEPVSLRLYPADPQAEAHSIAQTIAELRAREPEATIAVLVSAHAHAVSIVAALEKRGIESLGVDLVPLARRPIVRDLVHLSEALHDLADRSAWLAVLRSPWCGATLATLSAVSRPDPAPPIWEALADASVLARLPRAESARITRVRDVLAAALARADEQSPADWLESTWVQLGAADAYARADLDDAHAFFAALAGRAATFEWRGPGDFNALLGDLYSAPRIQSANPVQIMTIHRAKGLEFDHVFLPALERATRQTERSLLAWLDLPRAQGGSDLLMSPVSLSGLAAAQEQADDLTSLINDFQSARDGHERARLLYVAATRARHTLHLSGAPAVRNDGSLRPHSRTPLRSLWPILEEAFAVQPAAAGAAQPWRTGAVPRRLIDSWQAPALPQATGPPRLPSAASSLEPPEFSWVGETQRQIGIIVHALLARAAQHDARADEPCEAERESLLEQLRLHGVPAAERREAAALILSALTRTQSDARGRWILGAHREAANELALTGIAAGRLQSVVIDRCFVDESGTRWVIDYKTSRHQGADLPGFLEQEMQRYRPQLQTYAVLAAALGPQPVRAGLYFPLLGAFRELS